MDKRCYYDNDQCLYLGGLWQCQTCKEWYCCYHGHTTSKGANVECVACEYLRLEETVDHNIDEMAQRWMEMEE